MFSDHQRALHICEKRLAEIDSLIHTKITVYAEYQQVSPITAFPPVQLNKQTNKKMKKKKQQNLFSTVFLGENAHEHILVVWLLSPCLHSQDKPTHLQRLNIVTAVAGLEPHR